MRLQLKVDNEKGMTLVEILAALVILSIVLISFSSFFLQSAKNTKNNEAKLTAVAVAEEVVAEIRPNNHPADLDDFNLTAGFDLTDNPVEYENNTTYEPYTVKIVVEKNAVVNLNKAIITVTADSTTGSGKKSFITEMYFDGGAP